MSLVSVDLELSLRQPGCPICRLRQRSDRRYLFNLLYENVSDGGTRLHLVRGMGLCPEHAWALQAIEHERWHDGLGVAIIYHDLAGRVSADLAGWLDKNPPSRPGWRTRLCKQLKRAGATERWLARRLSPAAPGASLMANISPVERCRACELGGELKEIWLTWLVQGLADPDFRSRYAASDGLCLPHLRRALAQAGEKREVRCLAEVAAGKLDPLVCDLGEYVRKHDWNNREEPKVPREQAAWLRAVAFFAGEALPEEGADVYRLRRSALAEYRQSREE